MFENIEIGQVKDLESKRFVEEEAQSKPADKNRDFVQVYPLGWRRLQYLMKHRPKAYLRAGGTHGCVHGAVIVSQIVLAEMLGIAEITVRRETKWIRAMDFHTHPCWFKRLRIRPESRRSLAQLAQQERLCGI